MSARVSRPNKRLGSSPRVRMQARGQRLLFTHRLPGCVSGRRMSAGCYAKRFTRSMTAFMMSVLCGSLAPALLKTKWTTARPTRA